MRFLWFWPTASGYYIYTEATSQSTGDRARIDSQITAAAGTVACFQFWYHMHGASMGSLTVYTGDGKGGLGPVRWSKKGDSADLWQKAWFNTNSETDFQVRNWKDWRKPLWGFSWKALWWYFELFQMIVYFSFWHGFDHCVYKDQVHVKLLFLITVWVMVYLCLQISFVGQRGSGSYSDIAVDDISVSEGSCR